MKDFELKTQYLPTDSLIAYVNNVKLHPDDQVSKIASSIAEFGFTVPVIIDKDNVVIAGHGRLEAAKKLGLADVPCIVRDDLTPAQVKAFRIADNKVAESGWDDEALKLELESLAEMDFDLSLTGFDDVDLDGILDEPDFEPVGIEEQGKLDEKQQKEIECECPRCGESFIKLV